MTSNQRKCSALFYKVSGYKEYLTPVKNNVEKEAVLGVHVCKMCHEAL